MCERLDGIKHDIETDGFGDRGIFTDGVAEEILQRYFAGRLERASRQRYQVTREEEVAEHKEPDIRIRHPRAGVVSIEVKPLDSRRYSVEELRRTLSEQLVGQYMRAAGSKHGVLLLCLVKKRTWRLAKSVQTIGFDRALAILKDEAHRLITTQPDIGGLAGIGIDATPWEKEQPPKAPGEGRSRASAARPSATVTIRNPSSARG